MDFQKAEKFILNKLTQDLPKHLYYHSIYHVEDVMQAAIRIAKEENLSEQELVLLKTAVLYHDSGFLISAKNHEQIGCDIVKEKLPNFNYTSANIDIICGMIMATKIPQTPLNKLEQIICDADLDYLGRSDYDYISNNLFKEMNMYSMLDEVSWLELQITFLKKHHYFTMSSIKLRKPLKELKLNQLQEKLTKYKS
jgi:predicted metal-dependent HD superfamily phosphohydrolase